MYEENGRQKRIEIPIESDDDAIEEGADRSEQEESSEQQTGDLIPSSDHPKEEPEIAPIPPEQDERLLRLMAEFANFRKRVAAEKESLEAEAKAQLAGRLLGVLDSFQQMLEGGNARPDATAFLQGARLIYKQLLESLEAEGLEPIEALNSPFDPSMHEAVLTQPVSGPDLDGTVVSVLREGYRFRDKLLRPSQVIVGRYEPSASHR